MELTNYFINVLSFGWIQVSNEEKIDNSLRVIKKRKKLITMTMTLWPQEIPITSRPHSYIRLSPNEITPRMSSLTDSCP